jgi:peroxiredoxin
MNTIKIFLALVWLSAPMFVKAQTFEYEIKGQIKGLHNDTLAINIIDDKKHDAIKVVASNDEIDYKGIATGNDMVFAEVLNKVKNGGFVFFLEKGTLTVRGDANTMDDVEVTGMPINDDYLAGRQIEDSFYKQRDSLYKLAKGVTDKNGDEYKRLMNNADSVMKSLQLFIVNYIEQHPASLFSATRLYVIQDKISVVKLEKLYNGLRPPAKDMSMLKNMPLRIKARKASETGKTAPPFFIQDSKGAMVNLADYKGKYVLIDFWASWCGPCRQESPTLVKAYQKFKGKPFEIISVSSDTKDASWREAIRDDKMGDWIHICDFKGVENSIAMKYGVRPIPDNFLIDPDGKIIGRKLFGENLDKMLASIFDVKP